MLNKNHLFDKPVKVAMFKTDNTSIIYQSCDYESGITISEVQKTSLMQFKLRKIFNTIFQMPNSLKYLGRRHKASGNVAA